MTGLTLVACSECCSSSMGLQSYALTMILPLSIVTNNRVKKTYKTPSYCSRTSCLEIVGTDYDVGSFKVGVK